MDITQLKFAYKHAFGKDLPKPMNARVAKLREQGLPTLAKTTGAYRFKNETGAWELRLHFIQDGEMKTLTFDESLDLLGEKSIPAPKRGKDTRFFGRGASPVVDADEYEA